MPRRATFTSPSRLRMCWLRRRFCFGCCSNYMSPIELWRFLPLGYLLSILIETPVLLLGLSSRHSLKRKLFAGVWLTACTYPIVTLVLPHLFTNASRTL